MWLENRAGRMTLAPRAKEKAKARAAQADNRTP